MAFISFVQTLAFRFVYDDRQQILENAAITSWSQVPHYFTSHVWAGIQASSDYYRPLFLLWLRVNHAIFGLAPWGWHLTSVLCHVVVAWLVFAVLARLSGSRGVGFVGGLLFAIHPVHIENVAWISGITDPLMSAFLLAGYLAFLRSMETGASRWWVPGSCALFGLALLTKETAAAFPFVVLVYALVFTASGKWTRRAGAAAKRTLPFFVVLGTYLLARASVLHGVTKLATTGWTSMLLTLPSVAWLYVRHLFVPMGLSGFYGMPFVEQWRSAAFLVPLLLLAVVVASVICWIARSEQRRMYVFACCWMVLFLAPAFYLRAFSAGDIAHDRYLYLPSVGFVLFVALGMKSVLSRWQSEWTKPALAATALIAIPYLLATMSQQEHWATNILLYNRAMQVAPDDRKASNNLANELALAGHPEKAISVYEQILSRDPSDSMAVYNLGYTYYRLGMMTEAEVHLRRAVEMNPRFSDGFMYLGLAELNQGKSTAAEQDARRAIQLTPDKQGYHFALAMILAKQQNKVGAEQEFREEMKYHPESAAAVEKQIRQLRESQ